jgi:hypothetical protein
VLTKERSRLGEFSSGELAWMTVMALLLLLMSAWLYAGFAIVMGWPPSVYLVSKIMELFAWLCPLQT